MKIIKSFHNQVFVCLLLFVMFISSCKTIEGKKVEKSTSVLKDTFSEVELLKERIKEWEEYVNLIGYKDLSLDTTLRLTEGYLEAKDILFKKEMEEYEKASEGHVVQGFNHDKGEMRQPKQDYSSLIRTFRILSDEYRYKKGADAIHYALGYALYEQGERDEAIKIFEGLVRNYPQSIYLPEVNFRLGEFYFETGQMGEARESYSRVLNYPQSVFYDKAVYKLGWVYYKIDDFKNASDLFMSIIDRTWEGKSKETGLTEESVSSLIMSLNRFKNMEDVVGYLQSKGVRGYTALVLEQTGERLIQETRYEGAIHIYDYLTKNFSDNPNMPFIYEKMANLYEWGSDKGSAVVKKEMLVYQYNHTAEWYKRNYPNGSEKIDSLISKTIIDVSKDYHLKGKNETNAKHLQKAIDGYRNFLLLFPKMPNYKEINLLLAEALFDVGEYNEAAVEYEKTAILYQEALRRGEIAYSSLLTYAVIFDKFKNERETVINKAVRIFEAYGKDFSLSGKLGKAHYTISDMYAQIKAYGKAREILIPLTKGKDSVNAYKRIAELYLLEGNLSSSEDIYSKLFSISKDPELQEILVKLRYRIGDEYLKAGKLEEAIKKFNLAFTVYPDSDIGESALMKIGVIYEKNKEYNKAVEIFKKYLSRDDIPPDREAEARYRLGYSQIKLSKKENGIETLNKLIDWSGGRTDNIFIAKAELLILKERLNIYLDLKITQPFEKTLNKKTEFLNNILKSYSNISRYKVPELLTEIFFSMGTALENFRDSILQSERPADLTKEELEEYNFLLEEKAYPYDEKAVKVYENGLQIGREYKVYDEWVQKNLERLAAIRPVLYKRGFVLKDIKPIFIYPEPVMMEAGYAEQRYSKN